MENELTSTVDVRAALDDMDLREADGMHTTGHLVVPSKSRPAPYFIPSHVWKSANCPASVRAAGYAKVRG